MIGPLGSVSPIGAFGPARHAHHWMIGVQNGPSSEGVCKECGERRDFLNGFARIGSSWIDGQPRSARTGPAAPDTTLLNAQYARESLRTS